VSEQKDNITIHAHKQIMSVVKWPSLLSVLGTLPRTVCALESPILTALLQDGKNHETPTIPSVYELLACSFPLAFASSKVSATARPGSCRADRRISSGCWQLALLIVCSRGSNVSLSRKNSKEPGTPRSLCVLCHVNVAPVKCRYNYLRAANT
jgi:hypothetical protein